MKKMLMVLCFFTGMVQASIFQRAIPALTASAKLQILRGAAHSAPTPPVEGAQTVQKHTRTSKCSGRKSSPSSSKSLKKLEQLKSDVKRVDERVDTMRNNVFWVQIATILLLVHAIRG